MCFMEEPDIKSVSFHAKPSSECIDNGKAIGSTKSRALAKTFLNDQSMIPAHQKFAHAVSSWKEFIGYKETNTKTLCDFLYSHNAFAITIENSNSKKMIF